TAARVARSGNVARTGQAAIARVNVHPAPTANHPVASTGSHTSPCPAPTTPNTISISPADDPVALTPDSSADAAPSSTMTTPVPQRCPADRPPASKPTVPGSEE